MSSTGFSGLRAFARRASLGIRPENIGIMRTSLYKHSSSSQQTQFIDLFRFHLRAFSSENVNFDNYTNNHLSALDLYKLCVAEKDIRIDPARELVAKKLSKLQKQLNVYDRALKAYKEKLISWGKVKSEKIKQAKMRQDMNGKSGEHLLPVEVEEKIEKEAEIETWKELEKPLKPLVPRGMYIYGNVGTGKTVLMDMFFQTTTIGLKRRFHFHEFMIEVHRRIHEWKLERIRTKGRDLHIDLSSEADAIVQVARMVAAESTLLAFDEFVVTDCADALMMKKFFDELFSQGTVVVATSNTRPDDLYLQGLNRHYFLPFIDTLKHFCKPHDMDTEFDYRLEKAKGLKCLAKQRYIFPLGKQTEEKMEEIFSEVTDYELVEPKTIKVAFGRTLKVERVTGRAAMFDFQELCGGKLPAFGPADFQAVCDNFDTIFVQNVPILGEENHDEARRFVTFIDQVYDRRRNLYISAATSFEDLCTKSVCDPDGAQLLSVKELNMAMKRMSSRLAEMQNPSWTE
uniref:AAA+ ATPase domain-containing protein n=1 Tax=Aplanochytrium stocchinoi TaxID=215587 RepID=A0A7S3PJ93_9STRA